VRGDLKCPREYSVKVRVHRMGGVDCVAEVPSALAVRGGLGGAFTFSFL